MNFQQNDPETQLNDIVTLVRVTNVLSAGTVQNTEAWEETFPIAQNPLDLQNKDHKISFLLQIEKYPVVGCFETFSFRHENDLFMPSPTCIRDGSV